LVRVRLGREALSIRPSRPSRRSDWRCAGGARRPRPRRAERAARARTAVRFGGVARQADEGLLQGPECLVERRGRQQRNPGYDRWQRSRAREIWDRYLGLRRGARAAKRDVVVAGRTETRVLPLRREARPGFLPADE